LERGVRFVQLFNGAYAMGEGVGNWDGHRQLKPQYDIHGEILDQPAAALLRDLKRRGMLDHTLVVFCTEFGRMPMFQKGATGRDHNPLGFTSMLMGAGVKAPFSYGATDDLGYKAVENPLSIHDFHATILHLLGLDHTRLRYYHNGIERRLTDVHGEVIKDLLA
jgi:arylsulfatase A-like enzyme